MTRARSVDDARDGGERAMTRWWTLETSRGTTSRTIETVDDEGNNGVNVRTKAAKPSAAFDIEEGEGDFLLDYLQEASSAFSDVSDGAAAAAPSGAQSKKRSKQGAETAVTSPVGDGDGKHTPLKRPPSKRSKKETAGDGVGSPSPHLRRR